MKFKLVNPNLFAMHKVASIRAFRCMTAYPDGPVECGLKEAKDFVESLTSVPKEFPYTIRDRTQLAQLPSVGIEPVGEPSTMLKELHKLATKAISKGEYDLGIDLINVLRDHEGRRV